jgi:hypothetical protein
MKILVRIWKDASVKNNEVYDDPVEITSEDIKELALRKFREENPDAKIEHWEIEAIVDIQ